MLPKANRITHQEFFRNSHKAIRYFSPHFEISVKPAPALNDKPRFGIAVPKYVDKRSTVRHRLKRIVTETLRKGLQDTKSGNEVMVKIKRSFLDREEEGLRELKMLLGAKGIM